MRPRYFVVWFVLLVVAFVNGATRGVLLLERFGEHRANQLSCLTGITLFGVVIWFVSRRWPFRSGSEAIRVGLIWLAMTVAFEFLFFHYVGGAPWEKLLADYRIWEGRLWPLILLWVALAPWLFHRLRRRPTAPS